MRDRYGCDLTTGSAAARDAYVVGVDRFLAAEADIEGAFRQAVAADDGFALAHVALARTMHVLGRAAEVKAPLARAIALAPGTTGREQSHIAILAKIMMGQGDAAVSMILEHTRIWSRDAMTLAPITGVFGLIGFSGRSGREVEQRAVLQPLASAYGDDWWFRSMLAFAEIELHDYEAGLRNIEQALHGNPRNAHAAHIRGHLFYELGEREEGLRFLAEWSRDYPPAGHLHCHINWHLALWLLETGRPEQAWATYRTSLHPGGSWGPPLNVLTDCASFLARADMAGERVDPRLWRDIGEYAAKWFPNSGLIFADVHSALAFAMSGNQDALRRIIDNPKGPAADLLGPVARGFDAFARGDWRRVVSEIEPVLATNERIGGSLAQRDLLEYVVTCALLRDGRHDEGLRLISGHRPRIGKGAFPLAGLRHSGPLAARH